MNKEKVYQIVRIEKKIDEVVGTYEIAAGNLKDIKSELDRIRYTTLHHLANKSYTLLVNENDKFEYRTSFGSIAYEIRQLPEGTEVAFGVDINFLAEQIENGNFFSNNYYEKSLNIDELTETKDYIKNGIDTRPIIDQLNEVFNSTK